MGGGPLVDLGTRTKSFALRIIRLFAAMPKTTEAQVLGKQLLRSGASLGAHYREASRARTDAEFVSKLNSGLAELRTEADELVAIFVTCTKNAKQKADLQREKTRSL